MLDRFAAEGDLSQSQLLFEALVERHLPLVNAIASHYHSRGVEWEDLVQVGRLALCKAITGYRKNKGPSFRAYAVPTITGEIKRYFRDHVWDVRPPRRLQELQLDLRDREQQLGQELGHEPSDGELAEDMRIEEAELREARVARRVSHAVSIDAPTESDDHHQTTWSERLGRDDHAYKVTEARVLLRPALKVLNNRERHIIYLRFISGWTQQEIGDSLGISQMQVSRLLSRIFRKLRTEVAPRGLAAI